MYARFNTRDRVIGRFPGKVARKGDRMSAVVTLALSVASVNPAIAQRPDVSGTWELAQLASPLTFQRTRSGPPKACDADEAQLGLLRLYAGPAPRFTIKQSEPTLVMTGEDGSPFTFYPDGRESRLSLGASEVVYRARWTPGGALSIEWKQFGGTVVENYARSGDRLLQLDQTIDHPALSQPARQRVSYRLVAATAEQNSPAPRQTPATPGQTPDTAFRPVIDRPAHRRGTGPVVLIDEAHANFHTATGRYLPFAELLRRDGYIVKSSANRVTADNLRAGNVFVIAAAQQPPTIDEVTAIREWVADGGSLLLIADHPPSVEPVMDLASALGIRFRNAGAADPVTAGRLSFRRADGSLKNHPVTQGIDEVVTFSGSSFQLDAGGEPLLVFGPQVCSDRMGPNPLPLEGHLQGAVLRFGAGRVGVFGEAAMFSAQVTGANRAPMGMNAPIGKQNVQFLLNLIHWLTGSM